MKPKTYSLTEQLTTKIEELQNQTKQNGTNLDASTIVRLALNEGLPRVAEILTLETSQSDHNREIALV